LKNVNNTLPLSKSLKSIAVIGPNSDDAGMQLGNYHGAPKKLTSILKGIQNKLPDANITHIKGFNVFIYF
jgi:beta-glucosidase